MRKGLVQAENKTDVYGFELDDILAVREHWKGMPFKKLAKEVLLSEAEVKDIMDKYKLRDHFFSDTQFIRDLYIAFKGQYQRKYIKECVYAASIGGSVYGQDDLFKDKKSPSAREIAIGKGRGNLLQKLTTYILLDKHETTGSWARTVGCGIPMLNNWKQGRTLATNEIINKMKSVYEISDEKYQEVYEAVKNWELQELLGLYEGLRTDISFHAFVVDETIKKYEKKRFSEILRMDKFQKDVHTLGSFRSRERPLQIYSCERTRKLFQYPLDEWLELLKRFRDKQQFDSSRADIELLLRYYKEIYSEK